MRNLGEAHCRAFSRRQWLQVIGLHALGLGLADQRPNAVAGAGPASAASLAPLNRFPRMVQEHFVERVRAAEGAGLRARAALRTRADAEAYVQEVRRKIRRCFGPFPAKTPLNPRVTGTVERDAYKIDKVLFESRPQFLVTANLYVPLGKRFPLPGVVGACGHSLNGKAAEAYQSFAQGQAARRGMRRRRVRERPTSTIKDTDHADGIPEPAGARPHQWLDAGGHLDRGQDDLHLRPGQRGRARSGGRQGRPQGAGRADLRQPRQSRKPGRGAAGPPSLLPKALRDGIPAPADALPKPKARTLRRRTPKAG
jgi:hypothetical protein